MNMRDGRDVAQRLRSHPSAVGTGGALAAAVLLGIPTAVIPNPVFERKIPVQGFEIAVLLALSIISGLVAATYAQPAGADHGPRRTGVATGIVGWFAVTCPLCNPFVVALLGTSAATGIFARLQPALGALAIALAATALSLRVRAIRRGTCHIPTHGNAAGTPTAQTDSVETQTDSVETQTADLS